MRYLVLEDDEMFYNIEDTVNYCIEEDWHEDDDYFETWVNNNYEGAVINGYDYSAYEIVINMDDDNRYELKDEYCRICNEEDRVCAITELENAGVNDEISIQRYTVRVLGEEDAGDYDGDDLIESLRARIESEKKVVEVTEEEKKTEDDIMKLIQMIR